MLQFTESKYYTQNSRYLPFCDVGILRQLGVFLLTRSHLMFELESSNSP